MKIERTPETSGATQVLYNAADTATAEGRVVLFSAIRYLTGQSPALIARNWTGTVYADVAYATLAERRKADRDEPRARNRRYR